MKMLNQVKITFAGRSVNEGFARAALAAFLVQLDPTVPQLADMKTAVSEAVTNCIVHAYRDCLGTVTIRCRLCQIHAHGLIFHQMRQQINKRQQQHKFTHNRHNDRSPRIADRDKCHLACNLRPENTHGGTVDAERPLRVCDQLCVGGKNHCKHLRKQHD